jgi:hypothetical protein
MMEEYLYQLTHDPALFKACAFGMALVLLFKLAQYIVHELFVNHDLKVCGHNCLTCKVWDCRYHDCADRRMVDGKKNTPANK